MNIGQNIRAIRKLQGITLEEVGNSLGVSKQFIAKLEQGLRIPNLSQLIDICEVLHCTPNDVLNVNFRKED
jgi:transcriptional regulator with XRE-family HTH domain